MEHKTYPFTLDKQASVDEVVCALQKWGVVHIPGYLDANEIEGLQSEFDRILEQNESWVYPIEYPSGKGSNVVREDIAQGRFPFTSRIFGSEFMAEITEKYLDCPHKFNSDIYVVKDLPGPPQNVNQLHFDKRTTFKFFMYITDTTVQNGAFQCVPETHPFSHSVLEKHRQLGTSVKEMPTRDLPEDTPEPTPIEGAAGTLIIFTTDTFHRAGFVLEGERRVMRAHSRALKQPKPQAESTTKTKTKTKAKTKVARSEKDRSKSKKKAVPGNPLSPLNPMKYLSKIASLFK